MSDAKRAMSVSAQPRAQGDVEFRVHIMDAEVKPHGFSAESFTVTYDEAWSLAAQLMSVLPGLADKRMKNAVAGDCATCRNNRLFSQPVGPGGRMTYAHCPDCWERYSAATPVFPPEPPQSLDVGDPAR